MDVHVLKGSQVISGILGWGHFHKVHSWDIMSYEVDCEWYIKAGTPAFMLKIWRKMNILYIYLNVSYTKCIRLESTALIGQAQ